MGTLFRCELKRLLNKKLVWLLFALCVGMNLWVFWPYFSEKTSGRVDGIRAAYTAYDGRVVTDSLVAEVREDMAGYIAAHPGDFELSPFGEENADDIFMKYYPKGSGYTYGFWVACSDISSKETQEMRLAQNERFRRELDTGYDSSGHKFTRRDRQYFEHALASSQETTVVHYAEGWKQMLMQVQWQGLYVLIMFIPALVPLFASESAGKMEGILLCAARRKRAVSAKLLAALLYAAAITVALYGLPVLLTALTYGLDGASLPASTLNGWLSYLPGEAIGFVYLKAGLVSLMAALACALAVSLGSSLFRNPLPALLGCAAIIVAQYVPAILGQTFALTQLITEFDLPVRIAALLPAVPLTFTSQLFYSLDWRGDFEIAVALSLLISGLALWLTPRLYLRPRMV
jgi:ABC-type transport system involved in multi-copper enzyme maturation permease subunit